jgi:hypothetical protein
MTTKTATAPTLRSILHKCRKAGIRVAWTKVDHSTLDAIRDCSRRQCGTIYAFAFDIRISSGVRMQTWEKRTSGIDLSFGAVGVADSGEEFEFAQKVPCFCINPTDRKFNGVTVEINDRGVTPFCDSIGSKDEMIVWLDQFIENLI